MLSALTKTHRLLSAGGNYTIKAMSTFVQASSTMKFETLEVTVPSEFVYHVELNRPKKLNALNRAMWQEIKQCFQQLGANPDCRVVVLSGSGKLFTAGIDLNDAVSFAPLLAEQDDVARKCNVLSPIIKLYQDSMSSLEHCPKPVIAAVHSACIGAGVDMITAADIRYCSKDAWFQVKEVDIGMAADVGTLQRLPKVIGSDSLVRELCYTARKLPADEAVQCGLISKLFDDKESLLSGALSLAKTIASKSPVAVQGTKKSCVYSRDHTVQEGLDHIRLINETMLQSEDFVNATVGQLSKDSSTVFAKL